MTPYEGLSVGLSVTVRYANLGPKGEIEFQAQLQMVGDAVARVSSCYTKKDLVASYRSK